MLLTDPIPSASGRNSRASNVSGMTAGASHSVRSAPPPGAQPSDTLNAGVLSMLKTTTDTGDIGSLSFQHNRYAATTRPHHARRGHALRTSDFAHNHSGGTSSHHHYAPSQTSRISDSTTFQRRGSLTSMQSLPPSLPTSNVNRLPLQVPPPALDRARDSRSYSLTSAPNGQSLSRHRSATSLKSAGHEPRHGHRLHPGHPPSMPENRAPYVYPTRLKRPGFRSPSPALSDLSSHGQMPLPPQAARRGPMHMPRPPPQTYNSDYGADYGQQAPPLLNPRPPRTMGNMTNHMYDANQYAYRAGQMRQNPAFMHSAGYPTQYAAQRLQYSGYPYAQRMAYYPDQHPSQVHPAYRDSPPPPAHIANMGNSMFHNAARLARQLPQRTDTPMSDIGLPSSEPPSSGTAPESSSPPTPRDQSTLQVGVDPLFIDPALTDLPDSSSDPVLPGTKYFRYADGLDKSVNEPDLDVVHSSVPPSGFVQRVKAMLESKAANEMIQRENAERARAAYNGEFAGERVDHHDNSQIFELATDVTPRFTIIEEYEAPAELPASPVRLPELAGSQLPAEQRITRELVQAELAPSSTADNTQVDNSESTADILFQDERQAGLRRRPVPSVEDRSDRHTPAGGHPTPNVKQRKKSVAESAVTASPEASGISGMDYALRFSGPVDTTITEETQSKDPFILDADTITLQHQRSQEKVTVAETKQDNAPQSSLEPPCESANPVSPLHPHENNNRSSDVSPLQSQTLGIDETMRLGSQSPQEGSSDYNETSLLGSPQKDHPQPPTPRTPRGYSKSVQLPQTSSGDVDTPSSNRYSLPPDLSSVAETTTTTNSDLVTDVAVRFSVPNATVFIAKSHIITIPPSSSPERVDSPAPEAMVHRLDPKSARRNSVTFTTYVAPLKIEKSEPPLEVTQATEVSFVGGKSIIRRVSPLEDVSDTSRTSSTTELRFPSGAVVNSRMGSTHLPGLKEESIEDMSVTEQQRRSADIVSGFQFPLPARIAAVKAMQERRLQDSADNARARRAARRRNRPLVEIRDLPSLNFSRMDLIDKLNEALEVRPSKSMEVVRHRHYPSIYCPSPQRPQRTEPLRERYTSFFAKPEDFSIVDEVSDDTEQIEEEASPKVPILAIQESTEIENVEPKNRPLSPQEFLSVATQVNRLSIPSVSGLSERLTELLPCLKNLHLDSILATDDEVAHTIEDIHHLGNGGHRPMSARSSAGFRTLAERADEIVRNGTHDSIAPTPRILSINKALPPLPESASTAKVSAINSSDGKQSILSGSVSAPSDLGKEPRQPVSALVRHKSPTTEEEVRRLLPTAVNPIARGSNRRSLLSSASNRPWNQDENYPWSESNITVDLTAPSQAHLRDSVASEVLRERGTKSLDITRSRDLTKTNRGIDIGSITTLERSASITTEQATGVKTSHLRKHSKIIGSISRKIGLTHRSTAATNTDSPRKLLIPHLRSDESLPHKAGDRYPTTGLAPPAAFNLDEVRSFFSDDSSGEEKQRVVPLRKRLTAFNRSKGKSIRLGDSTAATPTPGLHPLGCDGAVPNTLIERVGASSSAHMYDGVRMGKAEFRIKRLGEKLRHLFAKSGVLIRSWSMRSRGGPRVQRELEEDWLSDSLYSGV